MNVYIASPLELVKKTPKPCFLLVISITFLFVISMFLLLPSLLKDPFTIQHINRKLLQMLVPLKRLNVSSIQHSYCKSLDMVQPLNNLELSENCLG